MDCAFYDIALLYFNLLFLISFIIIGLDFLNAFNSLDIFDICFILILFKNITCLTTFYDFFNILPN